MADKNPKKRARMSPCILNRTKLIVLTVLCLQNSLFTVLRRYSQGILKETYSKYEVLLLAEAIKIVFSAYFISKNIPPDYKTIEWFRHITRKSGKMLVLAAFYGIMNILSFVALRYISASTFTIIAQCKIMTTAAFSSLVLGRSYSWARWRSLVQLMLGVLLFSTPTSKSTDVATSENESDAHSSSMYTVIGIGAVAIEVTLSGFSSIYFEKMIKTEKENFDIWCRNFQLALGSFPIYIGFILYNGGEEVGYFGGWSQVTFLLAILGACGGLLVALSIKHGDSILKTLAVTGSIVLSAFTDHYLLHGPLTGTMVIAAALVVLAICNYTFDSTPVEKELPMAQNNQTDEQIQEEEMVALSPKSMLFTAQSSKSDLDE
eukprot:CAMPEP_0195522938 /NCGR_PEP_ID=MMETSP0794_2-20130614/21604_1 /TAXON_ID=515487 /ORGANISM="Stephanopyxis turris, Strain CCMP 815" /LENGTH=375 /DNA_ID=CAMNT_0040652821 /DNA_START=10 /DNA_END=1137 /DNA_ORIENTATION=-